MKTAGILKLMHINVAKFAKIVAFGTCDIRPEIEMKARKGLGIIEKMVVEMFSQDLLPHALDFSEIADLIGINAQDAKKQIHALLTLGMESYDGTYGRPIMIKPEHAVYLTAVLVLQEFGRKSKDGIEFVVRYHICDFIDIGAIETKYDMACYVFLIDYFEFRMNRDDKKLPITKYLKDNGGIVTAKRLKSFFKKQYWYGDLDSNMAHNFSNESPGVAEILDVITDAFIKVRIVEEEMREDWELNRAFDLRK